MENQNNQIVRTGEWFVTMLIMAIPLVNIIMIFVWAFGSGAPASKANWAKATLIWLLITIVLYILFAVVFGAGMMALASGM